MRAELAGKGEPNSKIALPDPTLGDAVPIFIQLEDAEEFIPEDYMALGYTHYQAWCVGAAGGKGADAFDKIVWDVSTTTEAAPPDVWQEQLDKFRYDSFQRGVLNYNVGGTLLSPEEYLEYTNPSHLMTRYWYTNPRVEPGVTGQILGGAGGGGGLHVVGGRLDDLPSTVVATVGAAGADAPPGHTYTSGDIDPYGYTLEIIQWQNYAFYNGVPRPYSNPLSYMWQHVYPVPFVPVHIPGSGEDGGYSSFGTVCKASGGKGGQGALRWTSGQRYFHAHGGDGGAGNRTVAGGGAAGGTTGRGADGTWDGSIGKGGGGGHGGFGELYTYSPQTGQYNTNVVLPTPNINNPIPMVAPRGAYLASDGGQGSFSYADTSVYGPRQFRKVAPTYSNRLGFTNLTYPGGGGGAKLPGARKYGGRAAGFNPNGAVLVRLTKVE